MSLIPSYAVHDYSTKDPISYEMSDSAIHHRQSGTKIPALGVKELGRVADTIPSYDVCFSLFSSI